jgi:hypothetical protein
MGCVIRGKVPSRNFSNRAHITRSVTGKETEETLVWVVRESGRATLKREGVHVRIDCSLSRVGEDVEAYCQRHLVIKSHDGRYFDSLRVVRGCTPFETRVGLSGNIRHRAWKNTMQAQNRSRGKLGWGFVLTSRDLSRLKPSHDR